MILRFVNNKWCGLHLQLGLKLRRSFTTNDSIKKLRNVGIIAHIDAGKTTTTERMLFYSGTIKTVGEVHDGDATMDYLIQERERGITINSAAISFDWKEHRINLLDTPGHVDFTVEVERCMRVLDGAVALFDAVAGVQAQSETVWRQAMKYNVPCIAFVNKMDREGADLSRTIEMIKERLKTTPLLIQLPLYHGETTKIFRGVINLIDLNEYIWDQDKFSRVFTKLKLKNPSEEVLQARENLAEKIAMLDDEFAELYMEAVNSIEIDAKSFTSALRRITKERTALPVLCGSAFKNTAIQPLMDALVEYLPEPSVLSTSTPPGLRAFAFKIQHDPMKGPLTFLRVYSGTLPSKGVLYNISRGEKERILHLYRVAADETFPIEAAHEGDIAVAVGLSKTKTGDTIAANKSAEPLQGLTIPDNVFTASLEMASAAEEDRFFESLEILIRDDPSLTLHSDEETGQILLGGMGELHLEIAVSKLKHQFGVECELGKMRVAYRETLLEEIKSSCKYERTVGPDTFTVKLTVKAEPHPGGHNVPIEVVFTDSKGREAQENRIAFGTGDTKVIASKEQSDAILNGILAAFKRGPYLGYNIQGVLVSIETNASTFKRETPSAILHGVGATAGSELLNKRRIKVGLLEPLADIVVDVPERHVGPVISHLTSLEHSAIIHNVSTKLDDPTRSEIYAQVPLSSIIGYSTELRSITSGEGKFSMEVKSYGLIQS